MRIKTIQVDGFGPAIQAMRNPMNSWDRSDTHHGKIGEKDKELSMKLAKAGPEHAKHLRMIMAWAEIEAPRFWWTEFDTYRNGVEKVSCSTMHKLMSRHLTPDDFEKTQTEYSNYQTEELKTVIECVNAMMDKYKEEENENTKKEIWLNIIALLPQSYIQRRTVMMSYAAIRNMIRQRQGHKLPQWHEFIDWCKTLPESWMLFDE